MIYRHFVKRVIDLLIVIPGLILAMPVMLIILILLLLTGHRSFIFKQRRVGYRERVFTLYKFKTMTDKKDQSGQLLPDAQRLTGFGKLLRKTSMDELPQLLNILKGDMSLVGPRPLLIEYLPLYNLEQKKRHSVKPGITGWAQVNGRNAISWKRKFELDVWYVTHQSFTLDLKIILMTAKKVLFPEGIQQAGHATMESFNGEN
jgi:lipopolysaccharide/colanic/teichoic acid biosynthesis glycosyltransferase